MMCEIETPTSGASWERNTTAEVSQRPMLTIHNEAGIDLVFRMSSEWRLGGEIVLAPGEAMSITADAWDEIVVGEL